jgi:hypothetical protein
MMNPATSATTASPATAQRIKRQFMVGTPSA